jgi:hypothetical protein
LASRILLCRTGTTVLVVLVVHGLGREGGKSSVVPGEDVTIRVNLGCTGGFVVPGVHGRESQFCALMSEGRVLGASWCARTGRVPKPQAYNSKVSKQAKSSVPKQEALRKRLVGMVHRPREVGSKTWT